jgi:RNA polymerase primary sigma factor
VSAFPKPMTATEELARAEELQGLRRRLWTCLLDYPPFIDAIVTRLGDELGDEAPSAAMERLRAAAFGVRERDVRETLTEFAAAREQLAELLHRHRAEAPVARSLVAEVRAIGSRRPARRDSSRLLVRSPPRGSQVFRRYVASVRKAEAELTVARQRFVAANLRLVVSISRRYNNGFLTQADLVQEGTLGLLRAVDGYDPGRGTRFSTYAAWWIKHGITRAVANHGLAIRVPANVPGLRSQPRRLEHSSRAWPGPRPRPSPTRAWR